MRIGEFIKEKRLEKDISSRELFKLLKGALSSDILSKVERGVIDCNFDGTLLTDLTVVLQLSIYDCGQLLDLSKMPNKIEQPYELLMPFKPELSMHDAVKLTAIVNADRLCQKGYQDKVLADYPDFELKVFFEYFNNKINDLNNELKAAKQGYDL